MKLAIPISDFQRILDAQLEGDILSPDLIQEVVYDTRKIIRTSGVVFFAPSAEWSSVYTKGI